jgi:hypothetical protein
MHDVQRYARWVDPFPDTAKMTMRQTKRIRPINSLVFISDRDGGEPPTPIRGIRLLSTPSCISVGCYPEQDGDTEIVLGPRREVDPGGSPAFDGFLNTPHRTILVSAADHRKILEVKVPGVRTPIRIWTNDPQWPDKVFVGFE